MGKMALLVVLGLSLVLGYAALTINRTKSSLVENVTGFDKYTNARNLAHTSVNMMLRRFDREDSTLTGPLSRNQKVWMVSNVMAGQCSVSAKLTSYPALDTVDVYAIAHYMDTTKIMDIRLHRQPVPFPALNEAVGLHVPDVNFSMTGSSQIDGRDHDVNGILLPAPPDTSWKPGVGVILPSDTSTVNPYASKISGTKTVVVDSSINDPSLFVNEYINAADFTYGPGNYNSNYVWGSQVSPVIVYCTGNVKFNGSAIGWGILVVDGNLTLAGGFTWHGLVVCYNNAVIDEQFASGTPDIIGATLMGGPATSQFQMKGNSAVNFSRAALELAKYIGKLQVYRVMYWYE